MHPVPGLSVVGRTGEVGGFHSLAVPGTTSQTLTYSYDRLSRLTSVTAPSGPTSYAYDPAGNRLSRTRGGSTTSYAYDRADRITTAGGVSYTVNANGNVTARGSDSFAYDQANRLISATVSGATSTYAYDGDGKRVSSTVGGTTTRFVYDVNAGLPVLLDDGSRKYVFGLGLAYAVPSSSGVEVYHTDGLGSVRAITDAAGTVTQTYQTDEFGIPTQTSGSSTQPFQYTGEQRDAETGFSYLRARMYDPAIGRFLQRDRVLGAVEAPQSLHRYTYVENNPVNRVDPSGLASAKVLQGGSPAMFPFPLPPIPLPPIRIPDGWPCIPPFCIPAESPKPKDWYVCEVECTVYWEELGEYDLPPALVRGVGDGYSVPDACVEAEGNARAKVLKWQQIWDIKPFIGACRVVYITQVSLN